MVHSMAQCILHEREFLPGCIKTRPCVLMPVQAHLIDIPKRNAGLFNYLTSIHILSQQSQILPLQLTRAWRRRIMASS